MSRPLVKGTDTRLWIRGLHEGLKSDALPFVRRKVKF